MACCGKKRKDWLDSTKSKANPFNVTKDVNAEAKSKTNRIFEYTGCHSLRIIGSITGSLYNFRYQGDRLNVNYDDSWALMGERDLKFVQ